MRKTEKLSISFQEASFRKRAGSGDEIKKLPDRSSNHFTELADKTTRIFDSNPNRQMRSNGKFSFYLAFTSGKSTCTFSPCKWSFPNYREVKNWSYPTILVSTVFWQKHYAIVFFVERSQFHRTLKRDYKSRYFGESWVFYELRTWWQSSHSFIYQICLRRLNKEDSHRSNKNFEHPHSFRC